MVLSKVQELIKDIMCNDEVSSDEELIQFLQDELGLKKAMAIEIVARRMDYLRL